MADQLRFVPQPEVGARMDSHAVHLPGRHLPDAEEPLDGKGRDELFDLSGRDREQSVGFPVVRSDLGQHLVDRYSGRCGQSGFGEDAGFDLAGGEGRRAQVRHVEERLVERKRLDEFGVVAEDGADLPRHLLVDVETRRHEDQVRTEPFRQRGGYRRTHPVGPGFVAGRGDDAPRAVMADGDRPAPVFGVVPLFDGGVERIHVDMYDFPLRHGGDSCKDSE